MLKETVFVFAALVVFADATVVNYCNSGTPFENTTQITISGCDKPKCLLKRNVEKTTLEIKFVPNKDIQSLTNNINGYIRSYKINLSYFDGTNVNVVCDKVYNVDGSKNGCPLKKGVEYVYKHSFHVPLQYPRISMVIRYELREGNDTVICFEVPSEIGMN